MLIICVIFEMTFHLLPILLKRKYVLKTIEIKNQLTIESIRSPVRQKYIAIILKSV
jgi:hypothetical protein